MASVEPSQVTASHYGVTARLLFWAKVPEMTKKQQQTNSERANGHILLAWIVVIGWSFWAQNAESSQESHSNDGRHNCNGHQEQFSGSVPEPFAHELLHARKAVT